MRPMDLGYMIADSIGLDPIEDYRITSELIDVIEHRLHLVRSKHVPDGEFAPTRSGLRYRSPDRSPIMVGERVIEIGLDGWAALVQYDEDKTARAVEYISTHDAYGKVRVESTSPVGAKADKDSFLFRG